MHVKSQASQLAYRERLAAAWGLGGHGGLRVDDGGSATGADLLPASVSFNNERTTTALNSAAGACSCRAAWRIATL